MTEQTNQVTVHITNGNEAGQVHEIFTTPGAAQVTLGCQSENNPSDIMVENGILSKPHAQITRLDNGRVQLTDLGSANGVYMWDEETTNWFRLHPNAPYTLFADDKFALGQAEHGGTIVEIRGIPTEYTANNSQVVNGQRIINRKSRLNIVFGVSRELDPQAKSKPQTESPS